MIQERHCSQEVSKLLRDKGFDETCDWYYPINGGEIQELTLNELNYHRSQFLKAPTHQMACDWLMTKGIYICPKYCCFQGSKKNDKPYYKWEPTILSLASSYPLYPQPLDRCEHYDTFGEAVEAALKYALKYVLENLV